MHYKMKPHINFLFSLLIFYFHFGHLATLKANKGCHIDSFKTRAPLLIYHETATLIYPEYNNKTNFFAGEILDITCPGARILSGGEQLTSLTTITCIDKEKFLVNGKTTKWSQIMCSNDVNPDIQEIKYNELSEDDPNINCNDANLKIIKIGFKLTTDRFVDVIDVCFDSKIKLARYSFAKVIPNVEYRARNVSRPGFRQDDLFYRMGRSLRMIYRNNQATINTIVNLVDNSTKYVNGRTFLNRGHLAPRADFFFEAQQRATFRYINVAPQWSTFNGGNWNIMEADVRNYVSKNNVLLHTWTGIYGISTLQNEYTENFEKLYLYIDDNDRRNSPALPVPAVFWKLLYDPVNQKGIVLVGHNNPYEEINNQGQKICDRDVSGSVSWLNWDKHNVARGYSYACRTDDNKFLNLIFEIPKFIGVDLLN